MRESDIQSTTQGREPSCSCIACRLRLEGTVSKRRDAPYRSGRGGDWLKTKCTKR